MALLSWYQLLGVRPNGPASCGILQEESAEVVTGWERAEGFGAR